MNGAVLMICASLSVWDGDTFYCDGELTRPMGDGKPFVSGFDTPEIRGHADCDEERQLGEAAKQRFEELLLTPGVKIWDSGEKDQWDRPLVWVQMPDGKTAGSILMEEGYARIWKPGHKNNWCDS